METREQIAFIKSQLKAIGRQRSSDKFEKRRNDALSRYTKKEVFLKDFTPLHCEYCKDLYNDIHLLHIYYNRLRGSSKQHTKNDEIYFKLFPHIEKVIHRAMEVQYA